MERASKGFIVSGVVSLVVGFLLIFAATIMTAFSELNPALSELSNIPGWGGVAFCVLAFPLVLVGFLLFFLTES